MNEGIQKVQGLLDQGGWWTTRRMREQSQVPQTHEILELLAAFGLIERCRFKARHTAYRRRP